MYARVLTQFKLHYILGITNEKSTIHLGHSFNIVLKLQTQVWFLFNILLFIAFQNEWKILCILKVYIFYLTKLYFGMCQDILGKRRLVAITKSNSKDNQILQVKHILAHITHVISQFYILSYIFRTGIRFSAFILWSYRVISFRKIN